MSKSNDFLRGISTLIEAGLISSKEFKKELNTSFKFRKDDLINKFGLVTQEEFEVQKKIIQKLIKETQILKKKHKINRPKKAKKV